MNKAEKIIKVALTDDHVLLRNALSRLIDSFENCKVTMECSNGEELKNKILFETIPDVVLLDLNMPIMDGLETATWLQDNFPQVHVLMLTMYDSELAMIRLLQAGVRGFLKKDIHPEELRFAILSVLQSGYYYSNHSTGKLMNLFRHSAENGLALYKSVLSEMELDFLKLACSDLTYKEIAQKLGLNPRAVDTLRDQLFVKLDVKSRVGLAMVAIRNGIVTI